MSEAPKNYIITGVAGFLGSNVAHALLKRGNLVLGIDDFSCSDGGNMEALLRGYDGRFASLRGDINDPASQDSIREWAPRFFESPHVDGFLNAACPASPPVYETAPQFTLETAGQGTVEMLRLAQYFAKDNPRLRFLQFSTSEVYGDPKISPQPETYWGNVNPIGKRACYDEGKRYAETACALAAARGLEVAIARFFNSYGPLMRAEDGRMMTNWAVQALRGEALDVYSETITRSPCYVDDTVRGIIAYLNADYESLKQDAAKDGFRVPIMNIGFADEHRIVDVARVAIEVAKEFGVSGARINLTSPPPDSAHANANDVQRRKPDVTRAKRMLGFEATTPLAVGFKNLMRYIKDTYVDLNAIELKTPPGRIILVERLYAKGGQSWKRHRVVPKDPFNVINYKIPLASNRRVSAITAELAIPPRLRKQVEDIQAKELVSPIGFGGRDKDSLGKVV